MTEITAEIDLSQIVTAADKARIATQETRQRDNDAARRYLAQTDWYVLRLQETGSPMPPEISAARRAARARITDMP